MMTKLLSLLLSFTMIFMSVAPSYAQARAARPSFNVPVSVQDTTAPSYTEIANQRVQEQYSKFLQEQEEITKRLLPLLQSLSAQEGDDTQTQDGVAVAKTLVDYEEFEKFYLQELEKEEKSWLKKAKSEEERQFVRSEFQKYRADDMAIAKAWTQAEAAAQKDIEEHPEKYRKQMRDLLKDDIKLALSTLKSADISRQLVPLLGAYGLLDNKERKTAAKFYREQLKAETPSCKELSGWSSTATVEKAQAGCERALQYASALAILGETYSKNREDAEALRDLLLTGYKGVAAPMVVQVAAQGLLALEAEDALGVALYMVSSGEQPSSFDVSLSMFSIKTWVEFFQAVANSETKLGDCMFAEGFEYSFYPTPDKQYSNKSNMWLDLGRSLAEMADDPEEERREVIRSVLSSVVEKNVGYDSYGNPAVSFRPFVVGAMLGGYQLQLPQPVSFDQLDAKGKVHHVKANVSAWNTLMNMIRSSGWSNNEFFTWYLYSLNKIDLDPATAQYIDNMLTHAHVKAAKKAGRHLSSQDNGDVTRYVVGTNQKDNTPVVMESRRHPSSEALSAHKNRQTWQKVGFGADIIIAVFALWKMGTSLFKWGAESLRQGTRILKLARAGQLAAGGSLRSNVINVMARARAINKLPQLRSVVSETVANAAGIRRMQIEPMVTELRASRAARAAAAKPVSGAAPAAPKANIYTLNGEKYMVFEGTKPVYVRGNVQIVEEGTSLSEIAQKYGVAESEVAWAADGSSWAGVSPALNYGAGEATAGSRGVQPRMDRPTISMPEPIFRVTQPSPSVLPARASATLPVRKISWLEETKALWLSRWDSFKLNTALWWNFTVRNPFRSTGMATSFLGMGGVAPVESAVVVQAPSFASSILSYDLLGGISSTVAPVRTASSAATVASSASALESTAAAANSAVHGGYLFLNPFWLFGGATSSHISPIGAIASADDRRTSVSRLYRGSKWDTRAAFNAYQTQLNTWLLRSNSLSRAQNPWVVGNWWEDVKNSISLGWQEFNLGSHGNSFYNNWRVTLATSQAQNAAERQAEAVASADETPEFDPSSLALAPVPASSSGYLYSGLPVMELPRLFAKAKKSLFRLFSKREDRLAQAILSRKVPLVTELRDIVTGNASGKFKKQALLRLHQQFNVFNQVIGNLPEKARQNLLLLEQAEDTDRLGNFLYSLYDLGYFEQVFANFNNHIPTEQLAQLLSDIAHSTGFIETSRAVYEDTSKLSADSNSFTGVVQSLQDVDVDVVLAAMIQSGWVAQNAEDGKEVAGGWIYYENSIPVYYRNADGTLSSSPIIMLQQAPSSFYSVLLSMLGLSTRKGIKVPKGMVLALDENGKFKFVLQPGHRAELLDSPAAQKIMDQVYAKGSVSVDLDTPYSTTDLLGVATLLALSPAEFAKKLLQKLAETLAKKNFMNLSDEALDTLSDDELVALAQKYNLPTKVDFRLTLNAPNSFKQFVNMLGAFFGLNVDSTMVGPFKDAAKAADSPVIQSSASNMFGGVGYVTPRVAGELTPLMQEWGMDKSVFAVLSVSLATLMASIFAGIDGLNPIQDFSLVTLALPMVVLVLSASLLRSAAPLLLNHYKDPQRRTAANLQMSSFQQGAKVLLALLTSVWWGAGKEFVAVPAAALLAAVTLGLFFNTSMGKKVGDEMIGAIKHPASSLKALWTGTTRVVPKLLSGLGTGIFAPFIAIWEQVFALGKKVFSSKKEAAPSTEGDSPLARYQQEFETDFMTDVDTKNSRMRVTAAYASYAASIMILNQLAKESIGDWGQWAVTGFAVASLLVRLCATKWVSSGRFTDDQLTGISFAGLAFMPLLLAALPYSGWGLAGIVLAGIGLNMSTAVPGQLDNTRLQNNVTAKMQQRKNAILQDADLSAEEKQAKIADLEAMEKYWAAQASKVYNKANANGIYGVYAAVIASILFPLLDLDWSWVARTVFAYAGSVAAFGAWKTKDQAFSFIKSLFSKKKPLVVTEADIAENKVTASTFGIIDENKANKLLPTLLKGKNSLKALKDQLAPAGVIGISSEVKLTAALKRMIQIQNRLVAIAQIIGLENVRPAFEQLYALARDYAAVLAKSNVSLSLQREFDKLVAALCMDGSLDKGVAASPVYMVEGSFDIPSNYRNLLEARDIILEMQALLRNIKGNAVTRGTYGRFVRYHAEAKRLLQAYMAENPSESAIVKAEEDRITALMKELKAENDANQIVRKHAGVSPAKDVQNLEDMLQAY